MISHKLIPGPGNVAVVREHVEEYVSKIREIETATKGREKGIVRPDYERDFQQRVNPWALVVGVGAPRVTDYGTTIQPPCKMGDKVLIAQVGRYVEIAAPTGETELVYVLPFEGVSAILRYVCSICKSELVDDPKGRCPSGCKDIEAVKPIVGVQ